MDFLSRQLSRFRFRQRSALIAVGLAGLLLGLFLYLSTEVNEARAGQIETISWLDHHATGFSIYLRGANHAVLDSFMITVTWFGSGEVLTVFVATALVAFLFFKKFWEAAYLATVGCGSALLISSLKQFFARPRPEGLPWITDFTGYSYPSGHATGSAAIFTAAVLILSAMRGKVFDPVYAMIGFVLYVAIAASRIYLGAHYLSDVLAGGLVGASWAILSWGIILAIRERKAGQRET